MKDLDLRRALVLEPSQHETILRQIRADVAFLEGEFLDF